MKTYHIKLVSQTNAIMLLLIVFTFFVAEVVIFYPNGLHNQTLSIIVTAVHFVIAIFLWQKFVTGRSQWQIDKNGLTISWTKKFAYSKVPDYFFKWDEIDKIWKGLDPQYYNLKFRLISGATITFYHNDFFNNDDFDEMLKELYQTFQEVK